VDDHVSQEQGSTDDPELRSLRVAREVLQHEAAMIEAMSGRLGEGFTRTVDRIQAANGRIVVTGLGKSGLVGRKIAATFASTGTPAFFVHAAEALHGDAGMVLPEDVLIALSNSGETAEVVRFARMAKERGTVVIALVGSPGSTLGREADEVLDVGVEREADPLNLAPTASTTATIAMGDALCVALMALRGFRPEDFLRDHPGGSLGGRIEQTGGNDDERG
jgi:arabinose-5-phosphate isomerase